MKRINYVERQQGGCGLTTDTKVEVLRRIGTDGLRLFRPATQRDVDWVKAMGGQVPEGRIASDATEPD